MNYDPLLVSLGYVWRLQGLPPDDNPSFMHGYRQASAASLDRTSAAERYDRRGEVRKCKRTLPLTNVGASRRPGEVSRQAEVPLKDIERPFNLVLL